MDKIYRSIKRIKKRAMSLWTVYDNMWYEGVAEYEDAYPIDVFLDERGAYIVFSSKGRLYKTYPVIKNNEVEYQDVQEVVIEHVPIESRTKIFRVGSELRFISIASAAVLNRGGEIDTTLLFDSMVENWDEYEEKKRLNFYHEQSDEWLMGEVRGIERYNELLICWGVIDETTELGKNAETVLNSKDNKWGLSIEFIPLESRIEKIGGVNIRTYTEGIFVGLAILLERDAASYFTKIVT